MPGVELSGTDIWYLKTAATGADVVEIFGAPQGPHNTMVNPAAEVALASRAAPAIYVRRARIVGKRGANSSFSKSRILILAPGYGVEFLASYTANVSDASCFVTQSLSLRAHCISDRS